MSTLEYLRRIYRQNPRTSSFILEISLDKYIDVFNEWDHSSFRKRDMDPDLETFLQDCSGEIPLKHDVELCFYVPQEEGDPRREDMIKNGLQNYFTSTILYTKGLLRTLYSNIIKYSVFGVGFLTIAVLIETFVPTRMFIDILKEGFYIGGWVFLWESISTLFFEQRKLSDRVKEYERFLRAQVTFRYEFSQPARSSQPRAKADKRPSLGKALKLESERQKRKASS